MTSSTQLQPRRLYEKMELQELNSRLADYLQRIHEARIQASGHSESNAAVLADSTQRLEEELTRIKDLYEQELAAVRQKADDLAREKASLHIEVNKCRLQSAELEQRSKYKPNIKSKGLAAEMDRQRASCDQMNTLQRQIAQKDQELCELQLRAQGPAQQLAALQREYDAVLRENQQLRHRYEGEQKQRYELDEKAQQLSQKLGFTEQIRDQQTKELSNRVQIAADTIMNLEAKLREISNNDKNLAELVQRVKDAAAAELAEYREQTENQFEATLTQFRAQIAENDRMYTDLNAENLELRKNMSEMTARMKSMEGQMGSLEHQKAALEELLTKEREHSREQMQMLESKMRELQEQLLMKLREINTARDAQISLKAEIESYRVLLEEEEIRLRNELNGATMQTSTYQPANNVTSIAPTTKPTGPVRPVKSAPGSRATNKDTQTSKTVAQAKEESQSKKAKSAQRPRAKSAGGRSGSAGNSVLMPANLGQGRDYFDEMFKDLRLSGSLTHGRQLPSPPRDPRPASRSAGVTSQASVAAGGGGGGGTAGYVDERVIAPDRPPTSMSHDFTTHSTSNHVKFATGCIKILEVHPDGKYIRLLNGASKKDVDLSNYLLQQNVGGHPVAVFRFPPRTRCASGATVTVWSGGATDPIVHQPPTDFVFREQLKWGTGPECTTILCKANGQAVAWMTAAHRFTPDAYRTETPVQQQAQLNNNNYQAELVEQDQQQPQPQQEETPAAGQWFSSDPADNGFYADEDMDEESEAVPAMAGQQSASSPQPRSRPMTSGSEELTTLDMNLNAPVRDDVVYLKREKQASPSLHPPKHPHGVSPPTPTHPHSAGPRPKTYGNDNSSVNRQTRCQSTRPDPIPGAPYAGANSQRMGSAMLRKFHQQPTIKGSGAIANQACGRIVRHGQNSPNDSETTCI